MWHLDLLAFPLVRHASRFLLPLAWAWRDNLAIYDSLYLALAVKADAPLLTVDGALARVARDRAGVRILGPLAD